MAEQRCYKCGAKMIDYTVKLDKGSYTILMCSNPKCPVVVPVKAEGMIPHEIASKYFPAHLEVF